MKKVEEYDVCFVGKLNTDIDSIVVEIMDDPKLLFELYIVSQTNSKKFPQNFQILRGVFPIVKILLPFRETKRRFLYLLKERRILTSSTICRCN